MKNILKTLGILGVFANASYAQVLVGWNTVGKQDTLPPAAADYVTTQAANISIGDWGLSATNPPEVRPVADMYVTRGYTGDTVLDTTQKYTSFTVTADDGYEISFTSLIYSSSISGSNVNAPTTAAWGYRIDTGSGFGGWTTSTFSLSQTLITDAGNMQIWDFTDFTTVGTVEFGFWAWGGTVNRSVAVISIIGGGLNDGLRVNGTVEAIPEPSTYALLILSALGFWIFHRRRADQMVA